MIALIECFPMIPYFGAPLYTWTDPWGPLKGTQTLKNAPATLISEGRRSDTNYGGECIYIPPQDGPRHLIAVPNRVQAIQDP